MRLLTNYILISNIKYCGISHSERNFGLDTGEIYAVLCGINSNIFNSYQKKSMEVYELID